MSQTRETRTKMLSSQLDFETVADGENPVEDFFQLFAEEKAKPVANAVLQQNLRPLNSMAFSADAPGSTRVIPSAQKKALAAKKKKEADATRFLAGAALAIFVLAVLLVFVYLRMPPTNEAGLSYNQLPETVIYMGDQVIRLQANIQVDSDDKEWLQQHRDQINNVLKKLLSGIDPSALRDPDALAEVQKNLAPQLNHELKVDKIQAVLLTTLLLQNR